MLHLDKTLLAVEQNKVLIAPQYNRYLAWGFSDLSIRIGHYDSDRAISIFENLDNGDILCAACPNNKVVVTAGTSTVSIHLFPAKYIALLVILKSWVREFSLVYRKTLQFILEKKPILL